MATLQPPNYLQGHAAPGALRPTYPSPSMATTTFQGQPNYQTREGKQGFVSPAAPVQPYKPNPNAVLSPGPSRLMNPTEKQQWYDTMLRGDMLWGPQTSSLASNLGNVWTQGALSPFIQGEIQYGGQLPQSVLDQLAKFTAPSWYNPLTNTRDPVGLSYADVLAGKGGINVMEEAAKNPFSDLAIAAHNLGIANAGSNLRLAQQGAVSSGSVGREFTNNEWMAGAERAAAAQKFLTGVSSGYSNFLNTLMGAEATQGGYTTEALKRITDAIAAGEIAPPRITPALSFGGPTPYTTSGIGPYGGKPLY